VTNAEYALFIEAGGYDNELWWDTEAAQAWRRGEGDVEGPKQDWREQRGGLRDKFDRIRPLIVTGKASNQIDSWEHIAHISDEAFEALMDRWYPGGRQTQPSFWNSEAHNNPNQPVVGICWYEARAYCKWLSAQTGLHFRLPTEVEWEAAARGLEGRRFAYGEEFDSSRCNTYESHLRRATPVGIFPNGETPDGCADLCGNIPTWTSSAYAPYPYDAEDGREYSNSDEHRVLRGVPFSFLGSPAPASWRHWLHPANRYYDFGFRLCCAFPCPALHERHEAAVRRR
jgi:formylglycine-generating enzyme required for sulfatase activity